MRGTSVEDITILYCLSGFITEKKHGNLKKKASARLREHPIHQRWCEKSEWIFFAGAKPAEEATWESRPVRGWRLITYFHFYF